MSFMIRCLVTDGRSMYLEDKSSNLRECITAMVEDITGSMDSKPADSKSRVKECGVDEDPVIHPLSQTVAVDCASKISAVELSPSKSKVKPDKKAKTVGKANTPS